jgi:hypothetical protein
VVDRLLDGYWGGMWARCGQDVGERPDPAVAKLHPNLPKLSDSNGLPHIRRLRPTW